MFGLQGNNCSCIDENSVTAVSSFLCDVDCAMDNNSKCGGQSDTAYISVYSSFDKATYDRVSGKCLAFEWAPHNLDGVHFLHKRVCTENKMSICFYYDDRGRFQFSVETEKLSWYDATSRCYTQGSTLISFELANEHERNLPAGTYWSSVYETNEHYWTNDSFTPNCGCLMNQLSGIEYECFDECEDLRGGLLCEFFDDATTAPSFTSTVLPPPKLVDPETTQVLITTNAVDDTTAPVITSTIASTSQTVDKLTTFTTLTTVVDDTTTAPIITSTVPSTPNIVDTETTFAPITTETAGDTSTAAVIPITVFSATHIVDTVSVVDPTTINADDTTASVITSTVASTSHSVDKLTTFTTLTTVETTGTDHVTTEYKSSSASTQEETKTDGYTAEQDVDWEKVGIGIALGVVVLVGICAFLVLFWRRSQRICFRRHQNETRKKRVDYENQILSDLPLNNVEHILSTRNDIYNEITGENVENSVSATEVNQFKLPNSSLPQYTYDVLNRTPTPCRHTRTSTELYRNSDTDVDAVEISNSMFRVQPESHCGNRKSESKSVKVEHTFVEELMEQMKVHQQRRRERLCSSHGEVGESFSGTITDYCKNSRGHRYDKIVLDENKYTPQDVWRVDNEKEKNGATKNSKCQIGFKLSDDTQCHERNLGRDLPQDDEIIIPNSCIRTWE